MSRESNPDAGLYVQFHEVAVLDPDASKAAGKKQFRAVDYIRIVTDQFSELNVPVRHSEDEGGYSDIRRFPKQWEMYKQKKTNQIVGTPLEAWSYLGPAKVQNYASEDVFTIEQLAELPDSRCQQIGGNAIGDRRAAREYLDKAADSYRYDELKKQLDAIRTENEELRARFKGVANTKPASGTEKAKE